MSSYSHYHPVVHQQQYQPSTNSRSTSVSSYDNHTTGSETRSQSSYASSVPSSVASTSASRTAYRHPTAPDHVIYSQNKTNTRTGRVVSVFNYKERNAETNEPNPGYNTAAYHRQ